MTPTGYASAAYAASFAAIGRPLALPASGGWIIARPVAGSERRDGMGCYPLFDCPDWRALPDDLAALGPELVSLVVVTDPFAPASPEALARSFPDWLRPYKQHQVVDLSRPLAASVNPSHQRKARAGLRDLSVEQAAEPRAWLAEWVRLYQGLIERHRVTGVARFSPAAFAQQLEVPGIAAFRVREGGDTLGMALFYVAGETGHYHLAAYSPRGYERGASFPLFWRAFEALAGAGVRLLSLGAGAGLDGEGTDGLLRWKRGWASTTRPTYVAGRILDAPAYRMLSAARAETAAGGEGFFPAYRSPA